MGSGEVHPLGQILQGIVPCDAGTEVLTLQHMGSGFIILITPGAVRMLLVLSTFKVSTHTALSAAVLCEPAAFAMGLPFHGSAEGLPVNALVHQVLRDAVEVLPFLFGDGAIDFLIQVSFADPGLLVALEGHLQAFMVHGNIGGRWSLSDLPQAGFGILVHEDVQAGPAIQMNMRSLVILVTLNVSACHCDR